MTAKQALEQEALDCAFSAADFRNAPEDREIFHVLSVVLRNVADKIDEPRKDAQ